MSLRRKERADFSDPVDEKKDSNISSPYPAKSHSTILPKLISWKSLGWLLLTWLVVVHYFERTSVKHALQRCQWKHWEEWDELADPHRIMLIADPQIVDEHSYPTKPRIYQWWIRKIADNYLHRNYMFGQHILDPDTNIFLGDLFDGGREWEDDRWFDEYKRYRKIFPKKVGRRTYDSIPGNHDIGFHEVNKSVVDRFSQYFGDSNRYIELGNHSIIMLDTISLSNPDPKIATDSLNFLDSLNSKLNPTIPRILLTHVPFYRFPDKQTCGPLREKSNKPFPIQKGVQYQTVIEYEITQRIFSSLHPDIIFAGDDHDYCDIQQPYSYNNQNEIAREIAVKSVAMTSGIKFPAIQLLSLYNPYNPQAINEDDTRTTFETTMCYMPTPVYSIISYFLTFVILVMFFTFKYLYPKTLHYYLKRITRTLSNPTDSWYPNKYKHYLEFDTQRNFPAFLIHFAVSFITPIIVLCIYISSI